MLLLFRNAIGILLKDKSKVHNDLRKCENCRIVDDQKRKEFPVEVSNPLMELH